MKLKQIALGIIFATVIAGCILAAGCVNEDAGNTDTGIVGAWVSEGTYGTGEQTYYQAYTFESDGSGTLSAVSTSTGKPIKTIEVMWGYDETQSAYMAYTPTTNNYDYLMLSEDGNSIVSEYGEIYRKI